VEGDLHGSRVQRRIEFYIIEQEGSAFTPFETGRKVPGELKKLRGEA